ncbi:glycosyltransferase family 8 protein [Phycomyces blakesleeanus]|uniref:Glycosyltransferase family 8 protein n=2 Tax=Phycomyces blakesleeanus TaxID=4837 RepID=A0A162N5D9_PHYB8|nr:glycosyltransferase family 8 protein [Phycomyces blakesleeanus NRRL 1555(-)]OAD65964.1 glycosyltransferase family 8 protein [Phycomyces blakesleeanus NRRL 1555(-)]|eukprot:XP_018284004.1 glycosyltransferase family 8 protein [Phycomyces blakesleeanus NRRL 1555(-)]
MVSKATKNCAWVVVLTSTNKYVKGVIVIANALRQLKSSYPLLVLHTPAVTDQALDQLKEAGCHLKSIEPIKPPGKTSYFTERFTETWTKLAVWEQEEYDRLVLMDADMLPLQNMDELMEIPMPEGWIMACHACTCNPQKIKAYPDSWTPANCPYTGCTKSTPEPASTAQSYFNSGLIVLQPSQAKFDEILHQLMTVEDLTVYLFPDQDFLNQVFDQKWVKLPYIYNALKTLAGTHEAMWDQTKVKNVHYILSKPWDANRETPQEGEDVYYPLYRLWWNTYDSIQAN